MTTNRLSRSALIAVLLCIAACGSDTPSDRTAVEPAVGAAPDAATPSPAASAPEAAPATIASQGGTVIDVRPLIGQSEAGVRAMLGEPSACEAVEQGRKCRYTRGETEAVFINGMADWITVSDLGGAPFAPATLARLGLGEPEPASASADVIRWDGVGGIREIRLFPGQGRADYIQIKAMTP